jgi:hypothetical protein
MERVKLESVLKQTYGLFATWHSDFAIVEPAQKLKFRGSGIPHCPLVWAADSVLKKQKMEERSFMLDYAAAHGSLVHAMIQKWFGITGVMYGRWKCAKCKKILPEGDEVKGLLGPVHHCGIPCEYEEYDMKLSKNGVDFSGHCDGVLFLSGKYIPLEMKERNTKVLAEVRKKNEAKPNNKLQCTSYRYVLPDLLYPTISREMWHNYVAVMYIDRSDIRKCEIIMEPYDETIFEEEIKNMRKTNVIVEHKIWNRLNGICETKDDNPFCEHVMKCFGRDPIEAWERILPGISKPKLPEDIPARYRRV